jgi:hypothetical protein
VREPLVDLGLFRHRTYSAVNLATLSFGIAFAMMFFSLFFLHGKRLALRPGARQAGRRARPLMVVPVAVLTGRLAARLGHRAVPDRRRSAVRRNRTLVHGHPGQ